MNWIGIDGKVPEEVHGVFDLYLFSIPDNVRVRVPLKSIGLAGPQGHDDFVDAPCYTRAELVRG